MTLMQIPTKITTAFLTLSDNRYVILMCVNIMLLALGTLMDMAPLILILTPILLPVVTSFGVDPVHFGMIMLVNLGIGLITPPVGAVLFVGAAIGAAFTASRNLQLALSGIALLAGIGFAAFIGRAIAAPVREALRVAQTVAQGDLSSRIEGGGTSETGALMGALKDMNEKLVGIVSQVRLRAFGFSAGRGRPRPDARANGRFIGPSSRALDMP